MTQSNTLDIGLDVHTDVSAVAYVAQEHGAEVISLGAIGTRQCAIDQLIRTRQSTRAHLMVVYEAGPCGYWLSRSLTKQGSGCGLVAPSLMPNKAGDRVTTDRRDVRQLAQLMRSSDLTPISSPQVEDDAMRDLSRAREEAIRALKAAQYRLKACRLRQDIRSTGQASWGPVHRRWLAEVVCPTLAPHIVFQEDVRAVTEPTARLQRLEQALHALAQTWRWPQWARRAGPCGVSS